MPITLGCSSCGKRFRARDESAGKKVKCPYCQSAVQVPTSEEAAAAGAPTAPIPADSSPVPVPASRPVPPPRPAPVPPPPPARPAPPVAPALVSGDWGALPTAPPPAPPPPPPRPPEPEPDVFPMAPSGPAPAGRGGRERPKPAAPDKPAKSRGKGGEKTPEQILAGGWRSVRRGLFWVQFALLWLSLIAFIGFGKMVMVRSGNELPKGDGMIEIEGYVNSGEPNSIRLSRMEEINLLLYGLPVLLGGIAIVFGRLVASGAPRSSGARGLYALSAFFGLLGLASLFGSFLFDKLLMKDYFRYMGLAFLLLMPLAEFWFLTALTASGLALKRPRSARAVGMVGFAFALVGFVATLGWELYVDNGRPKKLDSDTQLYEQAALMLGWLLLIGLYWRAVRNIRVAAKELLDTVEEG